VKAAIAAKPAKQRNMRLAACGGNGAWRRLWRQSKSRNELGGAENGGKHHLSRAKRACGERQKQSPLQLKQLTMKSVLKHLGGAKMKSWQKSLKKLICRKQLCNKMYKPSEEEKTSGRVIGEQAKYMKTAHENAGS